MAYMENNRRRSKEKPVVVGWASFERYLPALILISILIIWELLVHAGAISSLFFPAPTTILKTLGKLLVSGVLLPNLGRTMLRVFLGFTAGGLFGLLLGLGMGWSRRLRVIIDPFVAAIHPVPKVTILPLAMLIFGVGEMSKLVLIALVAFFPMLINTMAGALQINPIYFEVAESYGASPVKVFSRVVIPGSLPMILAGMRLALNVSLLITITTELVASHNGMGALIWSAWQTLRTEELYAALIVAALLGISFNLLLKYLRNRIVPWEIGVRDE